jgi:hypothetical protein
MGGRCKIHDPVFQDKMGGSSVDSIRLFMKPVKAEFILDIQQDQNAARYAYGQAGYVEYGIQFIPPEIS